MNHVDFVHKPRLFPAENAFMFLKYSWYIILLFLKYPWYIKKKYIIGVIAWVFSFVENKCQSVVVQSVKVLVADREMNFESALIKISKA